VRVLGPIQVRHNLGTRRPLSSRRPVDAALFTASLSQLGAGDDRIGTLERALALWTGPAFEEFSAEAWAGMIPEKRDTGREPQDPA